MADCIGTGYPQYPKFPCALVQIRYSLGENGCGHILMGGVTLAVKKKGTGDKEGKAEERVTAFEPTALLAERVQNISI